ncbi:MAG: hypothetical protein Q9211_003498 [Gyalolechia sp. 1 TL-2023]
MRRVAVKILRTARRTSVRRFLPSIPPIAATAKQSRSFVASTSASSPNKSHGPFQILQSAMYLRQFSVAAVVSVLASGVWYYKASPNQRGNLVNTPTVTDEFQSATRSALLCTVSDVSNRRGLIVEDDQFFARELASDSPITKSPNAQASAQYAMLTPEEATQKLRHLEESYRVPRGRGVLRYDIVQLPSNNPIEDDHAEKLIETSPSLTVPDKNSSSATSDWMFWSVFDGHSGWTTSAKLRQVLISFVARELSATYKSALTNPALTIPSPASIDEAIKRGFVACDHEIVHGSIVKAQKANTKSAAAALLGPALSGSCALLSFYDSRSKDFRVACTGDSRAVLGRRNSDGTWTAQPLSEDQTGGTPSEMARLRAEHPGEPNVVAHGRVLGNLEPSRAFGDAHYKWSKDIQDMVKKSWFGRSPLALLKTPPYVTAEPVVTTTKVAPENGDFVVLATDGLWEMLTNEEVVGLVGRWLEENPVHRPSTSSTSATTSWTQSLFGGGPRAKSETALPVQRPSEGKGKEGQRSNTIRRQQWDLKGGDERFVVEDRNAATHLVRNALGGRDRDMVCGLLALPSPFSRRYRDDLTVEVIFFGEGEPAGGAVANVDASASSGAKAKL